MLEAPVLGPELGCEEKLLLQAARPNPAKGLRGYVSPPGTAPRRGWGTSPAGQRGGAPGLGPVLTCSARKSSLVSWAASWYLSLVFTFI